MYPFQIESQTDASKQRRADDGQRTADSGLDVSVCIVNWNCRDHLQACLQSLREAATEVALEVLVVDNGSHDGAADMVAELFPEVVLIRNAENAGFARGNNQAAKLARGRYLFFLNNDTLVPPGTLPGLLEYARSHPEAGVIGPRLCDEHGRPQLSWRACPTLGALLHRITWLRWTGLFRGAYRRYRGRDGDDMAAPRPAEILMGAALFMSCAVFHACGAWDEEYTFGGEDIDLCARRSPLPGHLSSGAGNRAFRPRQQSPTHRFFVFAHVDRRDTLPAQARLLADRPADLQAGSDARRAAALVRPCGSLCLAASAPPTASRRQKPPRHARP